MKVKGSLVYDKYSCEVVELQHINHQISQLENPASAIDPKLQLWFREFSQVANSHTLTSQLTH